MLKDDKLFELVMGCALTNFRSADGKDYGFQILNSLPNTTFASKPDALLLAVKDLLRAPEKRTRTVRLDARPTEQLNRLFRLQRGQEEAIAHALIALKSKEQNKKKAGVTIIEKLIQHFGNDETLLKTIFDDKEISDDLKNSLQRMMKR